MDIGRLLAARAEAVQESVIRRVFEGARDVVNPINLSIGQPDFPVPEAMKRGAIRAIEQECRDLLDLCRHKNVLLISDEIYDQFTYPESRTSRRVDGREPVCPSPARSTGAQEDVLLVRGFGKTYGCTGWRLGYVAGPG